MADQSDKTEKPTPKKLKDTKEEGRTARSRDATVAITSLTATAMLVGLGPSMMQRLTVMLSGALSGLGTTVSHDVLPEDVAAMVIISTLLSFGTLPLLIYYVLQTGR